MKHIRGECDSSELKYECSLSFIPASEFLINEVFFVVSSWIVFLFHSCTELEGPLASFYWIPFTVEISFKNTATPPSSPADEVVEVVRDNLYSNYIHTAQGSQVCSICGIFGQNLDSKLEQCKEECLSTNGSKGFCQPYVWVTVTVYRVWVTVIVNYVLVTVIVNQSKQRFLSSICELQWLSTMCE